MRGFKFSAVAFFLIATPCRVGPPRAATVRAPDSCAVTPKAPEGTPTAGELPGNMSAGLGVAKAPPQGWPSQLAIPDTEKSNFSGEIKPRELKAGSLMFRVIGRGGNPEGTYWADAPPPAKEADWRATYAVFSYWNGASCLEKYAVPKNHPVYVWEGQAGPQPDKYRSGFYLPGGASQYFIPLADTQLSGARIRYTPIHWVQ